MGRRGPKAGPEIEERRRKVAAYILRGVTVGEIAVRLRVSRDMVVKDKLTLHAMWRAEALGDVSGTMVQERAKMDADERELRERIAGEIDLDNVVKLYGAVYVIMARRAKMFGFDVPPDTAISPATLQDVIADLAGIVFELVPEVERRRLIVDRVRAMREKYLPNSVPLVLEAQTSCSPEPPAPLQNGTAAPPST